MLPAFIKLSQVKGDVRKTFCEELKFQPTGDAVFECRASSENERLHDAVNLARNQGC